jgi:hypothetical protein
MIVSPWRYAVTVVLAEEANAPEPTKTRLCVLFDTVDLIYKHDGELRFPLPDY